MVLSRTDHSKGAWIGKNDAVLLSAYERRVAERKEWTPGLEPLGDRAFAVTFWIFIQVLHVIHQEGFDQVKLGLASCIPLLLRVDFF